MAPGVDEMGTGALPRAAAPLEVGFVSALPVPLATGFGVDIGNGPLAGFGPPVCAVEGLEAAVPGADVR